MALSVVGVVVLFSLSSVPFAYFLSHMDAMTNERLVFGAGALSILGAAVLPALYMRRFYSNIDPIIYVSACFSWTAVVSLTLALELDGFITGFMGFYFAKGEPYFQTAYGTMVNYWDGVSQQAMYLGIIALFCQGESYRELGLYWVGSIVNSVLVFLPGSAIGPFGIKWSFLLNTPYVLIPLLAAFKFILERPAYIKSCFRIPSIRSRPVDMCFIIFFILSAIVAIFRGMAVLGAKSNLILAYISDVEPNLMDPNMYTKMQMLVYMFYFLFYYLCAIYGLLHPDLSWMTDFALVHAGASAQSQFMHITTAFHHRTLEEFRPPGSGAASAIFWLVNLSLLIGPQLFAWRCLKRPDMFGYTYTVCTAEPIVDKSCKKDE